MIYLSFYYMVRFFPPWTWDVQWCSMITFLNWPQKEQCEVSNMPQFSHLDSDMTTLPLFLLHWQRKYFLKPWVCLVFYHSVTFLLLRNFTLSIKLYDTSLWHDGKTEYFLMLFKMKNSDLLRSSLVTHNVHGDFFCSPDIAVNVVTLCTALTYMEPSAKRHT